MTAWLEALKVGDDVVIATSRFGPGTGRRLQKVTRATRTQIDAGHDTFDRRTGRRRGGSAWHGVWLLEATSEERASIDAENRRQDALETIRRVRWEKQSDETLRAVIAALTPESAVEA